MLDYELIDEDIVCTINQGQLFVSFTPFGRAYLAYEPTRLVNAGLGVLYRNAYEKGGRVIGEGRQVSLTDPVLTTKSVFRGSGYLPILPINPRTAAGMSAGRTIILPFSLVDIVLILSIYFSPSRYITGSS
jgi:hypothetical protein